jgi:hypothetical protein
MDSRKRKVRRNKSAGVVIDAGEGWYLIEEVDGDKQGDWNRDRESLNS